MYVYMWVPDDRREGDGRGASSRRNLLLDLSRVLNVWTTENEDPLVILANRANIESVGSKAMQLQ